MKTPKRTPPFALEIIDPGAGENAASPEGLADQDSVETSFKTPQDEARAQKKAGRRAARKAEREKTKAEAKARALKEKQNSPLKLFTDRVAYAFFLMVEWVLIRVSLPTVCRLGRGLGWLAWLVGWSYRDLVLRNLRIAFGQELSVKEIEALAKEHLMRLGANLFAASKLPVMSEEEVRRHVSIEGLETVERAAAQGKGVVFAICHMGCWEALAQIPAITAGRIGATLYQPLSNPWLDAHIARLRGRFGFRLFSRRDGFHAPVAHLREGNALGILVDQHAGDAGVWVPLFGRLASTTNLAALVAARTGAVVLPLGCETATEHGPGHWRLVVGSPLPMPEGRPDVDTMTAELNLLMEKVIRRSPADWFWVHDRWKTPNPNFLLAKYKRGVVLPASMSAPQLQPFEILVRAPNWLGDACMSMPALRALKRSRPDCRITVLTPENLADLWKAVPEVDEVIAKPKRTGILAMRKIIRATGRRYEVALLFTGNSSLRSVWELRGCGIGKLIGYGGSWRERFLDQIIPPPGPGPVEHHVWHFLRVAEALGADVDDPALFEPIVEETRRGVPGQLRIGLCPGAEFGQAKRWPAARYASMARTLHEQTGAEFVVFGVGAEKALGDQIVATGGPSVKNKAGQTSLVQLFQELWACQLLITNDTGTMHLAASLGVQTVSIFGSTEPEWTGPVGRGHTIVRRHVDCSPCFKRECPFGHYRCMDEVTTEMVVATVLKKLKNMGLYQAGRYP